MHVFGDNHPLAMQLAHLCDPEQADKIMSVLERTKLCGSLLGDTLATHEALYHTRGGRALANSTDVPASVPCEIAAPIFFRTSLAIGPLTALHTHTCRGDRAGVAHVLFSAARCRLWKPSASTHCSHGAPRVFACLCDQGGRPPV